MENQRADPRRPPSNGNNSQATALLASMHNLFLSLSIDAPLSLSNELSTMRCCCRRSCFLYSSSFLFVPLLEEKSEDGGSVYFLLAYARKRVCLKMPVKKGDGKTD
eukprot:scaffold11479_cov63-Attheya_sp.AAC.2